MSRRKNEKQIVQLMIALVREMDLPVAERRVLLDALAREGNAPRVRLHGSTAEDTAAPEQMIRGIPLGEFHQMPYVDVGRRLVRDGEQGRVMRIPESNEFLPGSTASALAHLLQHDQIHGMEVIAFQIEDGLGTVASRKRNAQCTIAKLKRSIAGMGIAIDKPGGCHGSLYVLKRTADRSVVFSVDRAIEITKEAKRLLAAQEPIRAAAVVIDAIRVDAEVQEAHEILCETALAIGHDKFDAVEQLGDSVKRLEKRAEHLTRCLTVIDRSLPKLADNDAHEELLAVRAGMQAELDRIGPLVRSVQRVFGPLLDDRSPESANANEVLKDLRELHLGVDRSLQDALGQKLLAYTGVERLRNLAGAGLPPAASAADRQAERTWANAMFMMAALAPGANADIRASCATVEYEIEEAQNPADGGDSLEARWSREWNRAKELLYAINGPGVSDEETAVMLRWPWDRVKAVLDWQSIRHPGGSDRLERHFEKQDQDPDEDEENGHRPNGRIKDDD